MFVQMRTYISLLLAVITVTFTSCSTQKPSEGTIVYDIEYPDIDPSNFVLGFMPKEMVFHFKNNTFSSILTNKSDQLTITLVGNSNTYEVEQSFKFGTQLIKSKLSKEKVQQINQKEYGNLTVNFTPNTKELAGFACKEAKILADKLEEQSVFYTEDISFKDPNWSFPFPEIKGVPMSYQIERMGLKMILTAKTFNTQPVDDALFKIPNTYKAVDYSVFEDEIKGLLNSFMES